MWSTVLEMFVHSGWLEMIFKKRRMSFPFFRDRGNDDYKTFMIRVRDRRVDQAAAFSDNEGDVEND